MTQRKIWDTLQSGTEYHNRRTGHNQPPNHYTWTNNPDNTRTADQYGNPPLDSDTTDDGFRDRRLAFLSQFTLQVSVEGRYRYWRWVTEDGHTKHWERRPKTAPLPKTPGLWPRDE